MVKLWKVIAIVSGIALLLGLICVGVGFLTGGNLGRVNDLLDSSYGLDNLRRILEELITRLPGLETTV